MSEIDRIIKLSGFEMCDWFPEPDDKCENCGNEHVQMYVSRDLYSCDGTYWCIECVLEQHHINEEDLYSIDLLEKAGHPEQCAVSQIWGDGECECGLYKMGYDPNGWVKAALIENK